MDLSVFQNALSFWRECGFEPWSCEGMEGVHRRITFQKRALLGEIGRYYADDYLVWKHGGESDLERVHRTWCASPDVVLQRFVFLGDRGVSFRKKRSFFWGFRGFLELYYYIVDTQGDRKIGDLLPLIDRGWTLARRELEIRN